MREGTIVYKKKGGRWVVEKRHDTEDEAQDHLKALKANVEHDPRGERPDGDGADGNPTGGGRYKKKKKGGAY